jgi:hypothetical protein
MRWSRKSRLRPVAFLKKSFEVRKADAPTSDFQQRSRHVPHHVMQKTVSFNCQISTRAMPPDAAAKNAPDGIGYAGTCFGITGKVVFAREKPRRRRHTVEVNRIRKMKVFPPEMRRQNRSVIYLVAVYLRPGVFTGVKIRLNIPCRHNANIARQHAVKSKGQPDGRNFRSGEKICDQSTRVGSGISPAAARQGYRFACNSGERGGYDALNGRRAALCLPAAVSCSIKSNDKEDVALAVFRFQIYAPIY